MHSNPATQRQAETAEGLEKTESSPTKVEPEATAKREIGGRPGPDPTRYGDWEKNGRCIDF